MTFDEWCRQQKKKGNLKETPTDLAPVAPSTEVYDGHSGWWQKGAFSDGYQFGDVTKTILGTVNDIKENVNTAVFDATENLIDVGANIVGSVGGIFSKDFQDDVDEFIAKDLLKSKENGEAFTRFTNWSNPTGIAANLWLGKDIEESSILGDKSDSLVQSASHMVGSAALQQLGVPWWLTQGVNAYGSELESALQQGATHREANTSAAISTGAELLTEKLFAGSGLGEKGLIDTSGLTKGISNKIIKTLADYGINMGTEAAEEVVSQFVSNLGTATYKDEDIKTLLFSEDAMDGYIEAAIGGAVIGGGMNVGKIGSSIKTGRDYNTGLTANEQAVFDKVLNDYIAEAEKNGEKLTVKEKKALEEKVLEEMKKGYISTDDIESVLGGDTYKSYQDTLSKEKSLREEYEKLYKMKNGEKSDEQIDRQAELKKQLDELKDTDTINSLKSQLYDEMQSKLVRQTKLGTQADNYLLESYNEQGRRSQAYEADLSQYDEAQTEVIKRATGSKILNNTRRTHEFVDMLAKLYADKGVLFDFTNNERLKESGFALNGKTVNGYVTKDGITLNVQSSKALNSVVGHEITHVLEGTDAYTELQNVLFEYAKSKGDYQGRLDTLTKLYEGVEGADVNAELTADLIGDYLFTDPDFVNNLSAKNRNVFQKIYDEIKYLCKIATAGSKELRELEKVKRAFEQVYRENGKVNIEAKSKIDYSLSETTDGRFVAVVDSDILSNIDTSSWDKIKKNEAKKAAAESLKKFSNGIVVDGITRKVNKISRDEYTRSQYTESLYNQAPDVFADKMRAADVVDDIVVATTNWNRDGGLEHLRDDNFVDFDHGKTLIMSGDSKYSAEVVVGITSRGEAVFYDVVDMIPTTFDIKNAESPTAVTTQNAIDAIQEDSAEDIIPQKETNVKRKFSLSSDSDGKKLTKEQGEFFKDSKMRDENGNLKVMYHGSQDAGFHTFDASMSDDDTSFFFVDRNDVAASYSGTSETYEAQTIHTAEDMNKFIESIGAEGYEVVEKDGKFTLLYEGDRVADSNTAKGIYEEFCWYEGVGEGDANYKVYLNLTNPLVVDAEGRNWNNISREFSQEVYDRYQNLTAEEKAALINLAEWGEYSIFKDEMLDARAAAEQGVSSGFGDVAFTKTLARAYEKLGGANANLYDAFSIASDNFSEEALKEFAVKQMNTRDYAKKAKAEGYDGVIFNNIHDNGGYSNGSEGASTVAIAFKSEQIKSVANEKPTSDLDIRYSLSEDNQGRELSTEQKEYFKDSKIVDDNGNLLVMYHGTKKGGFTVFENKRRKATEGFYFTNNKAYSDIFQGIKPETGKYYDSVQEGIDEGYFSPETYEVYLDVKNPLVLTMDNQDIIEDIGYWENIYNPIKDAGYDGVMLEDKSQVFVFNSNQIKRVDNAKPTSNPDIRYSLSEYTAEEKKAHNKAVVEHFGKTYSWAETGYLLLDGTRLDLSGKHDGAPGGYRTVDHRDITEALGYDYGGGDYSGSLVQFMSEGNIRIIPECNGINLSVKPTQAQEQALSNYISRYRGEVLLDIDDLNGNTVVSVEYPYGTYYTTVLNDIREWFDNGKKPENSGSYSLTKEGETPKSYGKYNVYGKDISLDTAPTQEEVAPLNETTSSTMEQVEDVAPTDEDIAEAFPNEPNVYDLERESKGYEEQIEKAVQAKDADTVNRLLPQYMELQKKIKQLKAEEAALNSERLSSLDDADVPPEVEAPFYGENDTLTPADPFENRDIAEVGNRKVKAYMYENPEVKPFFQAEAEIMLGELRDTTKGERIYLPVERPGTYGSDSYGYFTGTQRHTTDDIAYLLDVGRGKSGYTYDEIEKGLKAIIEDNGAENNACSKRIEFMLNDRLLNGYTDFRHGIEIPPNQEYVNLLNEKQITEYNEEAFKKYAETADSFAPIAEETAIETTPAEDIAPTFETAKKTEVTGQQTLFEEPNTETETEAEPPKVAQVLSTEPETPKKKRRIINRILTNFADKGSVFESLSLKTKNRELQSKYNFMHYSESRAQEYIADNLKPIVDKAEQAGITQELYEYAYHLHNIDRMSLESEDNRVKREALREQFKGYTDKQIENIAMEWIKKDTPKDVADRIHAAREYVKTLAGKNKPVFGDTVTADVSRDAVKRLEAEHPELKELSAALIEYNTQLRKMLVDGNVISQETADLWAKIYPHYVPIRRLGDEGLSVNVPLDTHKTGVNAPIKRAKGGNRDILPLFDTMAMRTEQTFKAIAKNSFGTELMHTLDSVVENEDTNLDEVIDSFDKHDELLQKGKDGKNPTFTVFEDGKRVTFEITEDMYDALKPTSEGLSYTNKVANTASNIFRGLLTEYNPVFMVTNAVKDVQDVLINSQHAAKTYANIPKAIKEMATKGRYYTEYIKNGGRQNTYFDNQTNTFKKDNKGFVKAIGMPLRAISEANNFIERVPRLAEYIASRESGASIETAMLDAARVTTNFAAGGDVTKFLNRNGFSFLNASTQGAMQQVRNVREAKANGLKGWAKLATRVVLAGLPAILLNNLMWDDDEEYEELSDYVKQNYYVVAKYGDGKFVRIPKGRAVAVIQDAFTQMGNLITGDDEVDLESFLELVVSNLAPNNPLENNILAPIIQVANNETWYGEDLVPTRLQDLPAAEQYDESTDAFSKWLGEKLNVSPYKINYLLNQYSGGVGDVILPMITPEAESGDNSFLGNVTAPFKDKFTTDSVMKNQNVTDFYDTMDELTKNANSSYATDEDVLKYKYLNSVNAELGELYQRKREIQNSNLSDSEKYNAVREIQKQIDALAEESLNTYNNVHIDGKYATVGDRHYRWYEPGEDSDAEAGWQKITDKQLEQQEAVTSGLGISPSEYWSNKAEYDYAYENPEKYSVAKAVGGYTAYKKYSSELYDIKADKDEDGKSISGSRKEKVIEYINNLDADYGEKIILFKSEYKADDTYNYEIIDYLNSRDDISYEEMAVILKELGFTVDSNGNIYWD